MQSPPPLTEDGGSAAAEMPEAEQVMQMTVRAAPVSKPKPPSHFVGHRIVSYSSTALVTLPPEPPAVEIPKPAPPEKSSEKALPQKAAAVAKAQGANSSSPAAAQAKSNNPPKRPGKSEGGAGVGAGLGGGANGASYRTQAALFYAASEQRLGHKGVVKVKIFVNTQGNPETVTVEVSSGYPKLDQAAVKCAQKSTYHPVQVGGKPVSAWVNASFRFQ